MIFFIQPFCLLNMVTLRLGKDSALLKNRTPSFILLLKSLTPCPSPIPFQPWITSRDSRNSILIPDVPTPLSSTQQSPQPTRLPRTSSPILPMIHILRLLPKQHLLVNGAQVQLGSLRFVFVLKCDTRPACGTETAVRIGHSCVGFVGG